MKSIRYIRKIKDKTWYISDIFQKDQEGHHFTKDALLYQDILKYSYDNPNFKRSELDNWLVRNNTEFVNDYKALSTRGIRYSTRIHAKKERIDRIFNNLLRVGAIAKSRTEPAEKQKRLEVDVCSSKKLGQLIWLIIKSMNLNNEMQQAKRKNDTEIVQAKTKEWSDNNHNIYQLILSMLAKGKDAPYKSTMLKVFFDKLDKKGLFGHFVNHLIEICNSTNTIYDRSSLLSHVLDYVINVADDRSSFIDVWYASASELDPDSKRTFFYETKLNTEQKVINNIIGYSKEYEKQWFDNRADYNTIVLEGNCEKCKKPNVIMLSHDDHRSLIKTISISDGISESKRKFDCKFCNSKASCVLTTF